MFLGARHGIHRIKTRHLPDVFLPSGSDFLAPLSQSSDSQATSYKAYVQSVLVKQRVAGFRPPAEKRTAPRTTWIVNRQQSYSGRPGGAGRRHVETINSGEKKASPGRRREIAATAGRAAVAGRSETDPQNRSGERRKGPHCEGDHVAACAATPGPDDTHAPRSLVDVLRRSAGGRCRLAAARDIAPHHTPGGGTTAERGDASVDVTEARDGETFLGSTQFPLGLLQVFNSVSTFLPDGRNGRLHHST